MNCPKCGYYESKVVDSRNVDEYNSIRRRRECLKCRNRFTTYEKIEYTPIIVIKKNGIREQFDRDKVIKGMIRACQKRPVTLEQIEKIAEEIEFELNNSLEKEIESSKIGDIVIEKLKQIDKISYVRFASVYREFKDINEFKKELNKLK
ncbi:transcriptional repressor NrdR [Clostridium sp. CAG:1219]|nr:transcriptional repressor NrdR [Clostridium sp. CAG:1219]